MVQIPFSLLKRVSRLIENILSIFPAFKFFKGTRNDEYPITLPIWFAQKVMGRNGSAYWPMHPASFVSFQQKIVIGKGVVPGYLHGCYLHGVNGIYIGDYTYVAPNVGIMSGNHNLYDLREQSLGKPIIIGKYCWLGMNSMVLPEVVLGDFTIVGAGAVVTKSFEEGYCVVAGNPAKIIKKLDRSQCVFYQKEFRYIGYIPATQFELFKKQKLDI